MHSLRRGRENVPARYPFASLGPTAVGLDSFLLLSAGLKPCADTTSSCRVIVPGAPPFPRVLREGGDSDFPVLVPCPVKVKIPALSRQSTARQGRGTRTLNPQIVKLRAKSSLLIYIHVFGVDHAFVFLRLTIAAGRRACFRTRSRSSIRRRSLRGFVHLLG